MAEQEEATIKPEKYLGSEIEEIVIEGGEKIFREVRILLKSGIHISLRARLDVSAGGIRPDIVASRGKWMKGTRREKRDD